MSAQPPRPGPPPASIFSLQIPASLARFDVPAREYLSRNSTPWDGLAVGALVFFPSSATDRILLIQRAKTDSLPNKWEIPSGVVSNDPAKDATVTKAVARELWEEAGLTARALRRNVDAPGEEGFVFTNSTKTKVFCRFVFEVDVEEGEKGPEEIKLNPSEHQDFVLATEEEVRELTVSSGEEKREIELTSEHLRSLILEGFRLRREDADAAVPS
jgi:8-oxo-dGTP pyrophosphatase MutT (NUDIX family)